MQDVSTLVDQLQWLLEIAGEYNSTYARVETLMYQNGYVLHELRDRYHEITRTGFELVIAKVENLPDAITWLVNNLSVKVTPK